MSRSRQDVSGDEAWANEWLKRNGSPCLGTLVLYTSAKGGRQSLSCKIKKPKRKKIRKRLKFRKVTSAFSRYRERGGIKDPSFYGYINGSPLAAGAKIGVLKKYSNGVLQSSENVNLTGTPGESLSKVRTWDQLNAGPPYLSGGPFASISIEVPASVVKGHKKYSTRGNPNFPSSLEWVYEGAFVDSPSEWGSDTISNYLTTGVPSLTGYDTRAWDELKPHVTKNDLAQFLYELRDMPRLLVSTAQTMHNVYKSFGGGYSRVTMHPKSAADAFLSHEFGWAPFVSDYIGLVKSFMDSRAYMAETVRLNNTWVRKRRVLEAKTEQSLVHRGYSSGTDPSNNSSKLSGLLAPMLIDGISTTGFYDIRQIREEKVWAVGSFKYYRPEFDDNLASFGSPLVHAQRLITMAGLRINPTLLWRITPWSWAVDWFSHFGRFIQRADDFIIDGIVARYLYVMREVKRFVTKTSVMNFYSGKTTLNWQRKFVQKQRKVADSPYGFDRPWAGLSARQAAILGAVGITNLGNGFISRG